MVSSASTSVLHVAQFLGLSTSLFLSGINFSASHMAVPVLRRLDPEHANLGAFAELYHRGARTVVPLAVLSALASVFVATQTAAAERAVWSAAAIATLATVPFTRLILRETSQTLRSEGGRDAEVEAEAPLLKGQEFAAVAVAGPEVERLLRRWKRVNIVRSAFALWGGLLAAYAVVFAT